MNALEFFAKITSYSKVLKSDGAISFCIAKSAMINTIGTFVFFRNLCFSGYFKIPEDSGCSPIGGRDSDRSEDMVRETLKEEKSPVRFHDEPEQV